MTSLHASRGLPKLIGTSCELPHLDVPRTPGIYALWVDDELLYIGIARVIQAARTMRGHLNVDKPDQSHLVRKSKE